MSAGKAMYMHIILATKGWQPKITDKVKTQIVNRLARNFKIKNSELLVADGGAEHLHILGRFASEIPFSRIIGWSKGECSHWINASFPEIDFYWQKGYWHEVIPPDQIGEIEAYIKRQEIVHRELAFEEEIKQLRKSRNLAEM